MNASPSLSHRLKTGTAAEHERMHALMAQLQPFESREAYARFVAAQYLFQRDVELLFADPAVKAMLPDADMRGRVDAALDDLSDLGQSTPAQPPASVQVAMPEALGWLYVSEGSTLGAAFLLKEAQDKLGLSSTFGARHLAAYPEGRAAAWRSFVAALDLVQEPRTQSAVVQGALAAFARFAQLLQQQFATDRSS